MREPQACAPITSTRRRYLLSLSSGDTAFANISATFAVGCTKTTCHVCAHQSKRASLPLTFLLFSTGFSLLFFFPFFSADDISAGRTNTSSTD